MKQYLLLFITGLTLFWSASCIAAPGELGDNGGDNTNPHNLSSLSGNNAYKAVVQATPGKETQICIFCHTPHGATPQSTLWSRPDPTGPMGGFPLFATSSIQDTSGLLGIDDPIVSGGVITTHYGDTTSGYEYPNGTSKLCLSCHDGVTAMGVLAHETIDMTGSGLVTGAAVIDLSISHPISFIYNSTVQTYLNGLPKADSYLLPSLASGYLDGDSRVQCTSCHQPHQDTRATNSLPFWRDMTETVTNTAYNNVCGACHGTTSYTQSPDQLPDHNYP